MSPECCVGSWQDTRSMSVAKSHPSYDQGVEARHVDVLTSIICCKQNRVSEDE